MELDAYRDGRTVAEEREGCAVQASQLLLRQGD